MESGDTMRDFIHCVVWFFCLLTILVQFYVIDRLHGLNRQIEDVAEKVMEHDEIMQAYAFYNWKMKFFEEKEAEK